MQEAERKVKCLAAVLGEKYMSLNWGAGGENGRERFEQC